VKMAQPAFHVTGNGRGHSADFWELPLQMLMNFVRRLFRRPLPRKRKRTMVILSALLLAAPIVFAQTPPPEAESQIQDNSFLIEEAYNHDPGVVQHNSLEHPFVTQP
jgi:hypothetical protein